MVQPNKKRTGYASLAKRYSRAASSSARRTTTATYRSIANPQQNGPIPRRTYMRPEVKVIDTVIPTTWDSGNSAANNVISLVSLTNGTGINQRIGNSISCKTLEIVGGIYGGSNQSVIPQICRLMIVWDKQPDPTAVPTAPAPSLLNSATPGGLINVTNTDRYTILYDKLFPIGTASGFFSNPGFNSARAFHINLDLKNIEVRYQTGAVFPTSNNLVLISMTETVPGLNTNPTWVGYASARVRFTDV